MGTNYFLSLKLKNINELNNVNHILSKQDNSYSFYNQEDSITSLTNGYVYKNTYYRSYEEIEEDGIEKELHIGKSSAGWHFSLCIYPELGIKDLADWVKLFDEYEIYNEYGDTITKSDMLKTITKRESFYTREKDALELKEEEIAMAKNHGKRGFNGLWAHNVPYFKNTNGTYDLTERWNYS